MHVQRENLTTAKRFAHFLKAYRDYTLQLYCATRVTVFLDSQIVGKPKVNDDNQEICMACEKLCCGIFKNETSVNQNTYNK